MSQYHDRLNKVNKNYNDPDKTVWDSIDRPIRPLIYQIHRIGLKTKFSCCGFNYDGEEEPKNHHAKLTYVFVYTPDLKNQQSVYAFFNLVQLSQIQGWKFAYFNNNIWHLYCENPREMKELYDKTDGQPKSIHDYETQVIKIFNLSEMLKQIPDMPEMEDLEIIDGNQMYKEAGIDEWQVKPKQSIALRVAKKQMEDDKIKSEINQITK